MSYEQLLTQLKNELEPLNFECYPFKVKQIIMLKLYLNLIDLHFIKGWLVQRMC